MGSEFDKRTIFDNTTDEPYFIGCEYDQYNLNEQKNIEWKKGCVTSVQINENSRELIFEKKNDACAKGYKEYKWNLETENWIPIKCQIEGINV